jgi:hypothetical protein
MAIQETWDGYYGPVIYNGTKYGVIHSDYGNLPYSVTYVSLACTTNSIVFANDSNMLYLLHGQT